MTDLSKRFTPRERPTMPEGPVIKVFMPDEMRQTAREKLQAIDIKLQDDETRQKITETLNEFGVRALVIAPDYDKVRREDTGAELISYLHPGNRPLTPLARVALVRQIKGILGEEKMGGISFDRQHEEGWLEAYKIADSQQNPLRQVFAELDSRAATSTREVS